MIRRFAIRFFTLCLLALFVAGTQPVLAQAPQQTDEITLLTPAFASDTPGLGANVSLILGLQIWQTLRQAPFPNPKGLYFGDGKIVWSMEGPPPTSHREAEAQARNVSVLAQIVLWGEAVPYGDGVIVETHLSLPDYRDFRTRRNELWSVDPGDGMPVVCDVPRRRISFEPIVLRPDIVASYGRGASLPVFADKAMKRRIGRLGQNFTAIEHHQDRARVVTQWRGKQLEGWVPLPLLGEQRSEIVDFVGGIIRIYRADWAGARALFDRVLDNPAVPTEVRIDAALYNARAAVNLARDPRADIRKAAAYGARTKRLVVYGTMADLWADVMERRGSDPRSTRQSLKSHEAYFPAQDPWLGEAYRALTVREQRTRDDP